MSEKIQKILANAGLGSRRQLEIWIKEGRIKVNGRVATIGDRITYHDHIAVDDREIKLQRSKNSKTRVLLYHKPEGELCTRHDPEGRPTIFEQLPIIRNSRWICVGRLDYNTSGLLLLTNDGELANKLMHPSSEIEREYAVRIRGEVPDHVLARLQKGVKLDDGMARFNLILDAGGSNGANHWYHVTVKEGRNRLVRRLFEAVDCTVSRLIRIRFGTVLLPPRLRRSQQVELTPDEVDALHHYVQQLTHKT